MFSSISSSYKQNQEISVEQNDSIQNQKNEKLSPIRAEMNRVRNQKNKTKKETLKKLTALEQLTEKKAELENNIKEKKQQIQTYKQQKFKELKELEAAYNYNILAEIYEVISEIATSQDYRLIIDKHNVIYGDELNNLTNLVSKKLEK